VVEISISNFVIEEVFMDEWRMALKILLGAKPFTKTYLSIRHHRKGNALRIYALGWRLIQLM